MKHPFLFLLIVIILSLSGCQNDKVSPIAVQLSVDYTWQGLKPCGWGNPEIHVNGVPEKTKSLKISMYDHAYSHDHGTVKMVYPYKVEYREAEADDGTSGAFQKCRSLISRSSGQTL